MIALPGCAAPEPPSLERQERGCIFMLPGVEGGQWQLVPALRGLRSAGIDLEVDIIAWGIQPFGSIANLTDLAANLKRAKEIAGRISAYKKNHPNRPAYLVGYSGGGGLSLLTTEALADNVKLERLILIAAAVSPDYDLSKAMTHCNRGIVNYYSPHDTFVLGFGTRTFGTIDRKNTDSAGQIGFCDADRKLRTVEGLTQIVWESQWANLGHWGGHVGWLAGEWSREVLSKQFGG
jgi:pimeloyl-ACP methyl ester carboxylesterase